MRKSLLALSMGALSGVLLNVTGCGKNTSSNSESQLKHDANEPVRNTSFSNWYTVDRETYFQNVTAFSQIDKAQALPESHEATAAVQKMINQIDGQLRKKFPQKFKAVPKPLAMVVASKSPNAFVAGVPVCLETSKLTVGEKTYSEDTTEVDVLIDRKLGRLFGYSGPCVRSVEGKSKTALLKELAKVTTENNEACRLKVSANGEDVSIEGEKCQISPALSSLKKQPQGIAILQVVPVIHVTTAMISKFSEEALFTVVAHELAHFYRSHQTSAGDDYGYFYKIDEKNVAAKPVADDSLAKTGDQAQKATLVYSRLVALKEGEKQSLHSALAPALAGLPKLKCSGIKGIKCSEECKSFAKFSKSDRTKMGMFPGVGLSSEASVIFTSFEEQALQCLATIAIESKDDLPKAVTDLKNALTQGQLPSGELVPALGSSTTLFIWASQLISMPYLMRQDITNYADLLGAVTAFYRDLEKATGSYLADTSVQKLGYYTHEQEADEEAVEWVNQAGASSKAVGDSFVNFLKISNSNGKQLPGYLSYEKCKVLRDNNWKDADGVYQFVGVADFIDAHHSLCYRAFNADREMIAHKIPAISESQLVKSQINWSQMQEALPENSSEKKIDRRIFDLNRALKIEQILAEDVIKAAVRDESCTFAH